ncbi:hypothetical protein PghCCS26_09110 [Paenibacillus glycanilyticus]|uniref:Uncharacterized protein n=1 Tax=Paenibacillus glycanilyticus TaxID=126569 RepID=A0ABQ6NIC0_9BACL|nr:hypothetical protein PghCCS26_09110 [Paenibacillus glycanilyticus]
MDNKRYLCLFNKQTKMRDNNISRAGITEHRTGILYKNFFLFYLPELYMNSRKCKGFY